MKKKHNTFWLVFFLVLINIAIIISTSLAIQAFNNQSDISRAKTDLKAIIDDSRAYNIIDADCRYGYINRFFLERSDARYVAHYLNDSGTNYKDIMTAVERAGFRERSTYTQYEIIGETTYISNNNPRIKVHLDITKSNAQYYINDHCSETSMSGSYYTVPDGKELFTISYIIE